MHITPCWLLNPEVNMMLKIKDLIFLIPQLEDTRQRIEKRKKSSMDLVKILASKALYFVYLS